MRRQSSGRHRDATERRRCSTHVGLLVLLIMATCAQSGHPHHRGPLDTVHNCGTSRTITVTCLMDASAKQVLDVRLDNADGASDALCDVAPRPGLNEKTFHLAPGDNIYGVQACYVEDRLVGITFSSAGGALVCGAPTDPDAQCQSTVVADQAPLAAMHAVCNKRGIERVTRVCFNGFYVNPLIPVTTCLPGQGRTDADEPCQPCARNFYNPGGLQAECLPCPDGLVTIAQGASRCGCPPGYGANPSRNATAPLCMECAPGTYYPGGNVEPCWRCRGSAFLTTRPGAASIVQCVCRPGYGATIDAPNTCQPCPKGTFSNSLAEVIPHDSFDSLVRFPPGTGNGKGKGGIYTSNPTWKACTSCCEGSTLHACGLTTATPGSTSFDECKPNGSFNDTGSAM